jgi:hypothetical protein
MKKILVCVGVFVKIFEYCFLDNAFNRGRGTGVERPDRPRTFTRRWHIQQRVIK